VQTAGFATAQEAFTASGYNDENGNAKSPWNAENGDLMLGVKPDAEWSADSADLTIKTAEELAAFAQAVNNGNTFAGKLVVLDANIDLKNKEWTPIGNSDHNFSGTFDGQGHTISNLQITGGSKSNIGLFGFTTNGLVKNLTVKNAKVSGRLNVGVIAGTPYTSKYDNITVTGHVEVNGMSYVGGVFGKNVYANVDNIKVNVDETSYVRVDSIENGVAYRSYVGGVMGFMGEGTHVVSNVHSNIDVYGNVKDIGGITGIAHYGNTFRNIVCTGDVYQNNTDPANTNALREIGGIAGVWMNSNAGVTFDNVVFTGKLNAAGVKLDDGTNPHYPLAGVPYSATGTAELRINEWNGAKAANAQELVNALNEGQNVALTADVTMPTDTFINVPADSNATINLGGYTLTAESKTVPGPKDGNIAVIPVKGTLKVTDGTITYKHIGSNMAWNKSSNIFDLSFGGKLTLENVTLKNEGGTDMAFAVNMGNMNSDGSLTIINSDIQSNYIAVRVFNNSKNAKHNVNISNSNIYGKNRAFWVHFDEESDAKYEDQLNLNIYKKGNTFGWDSANSSRPAPICYGFDNERYFDGNGVEHFKPVTE